MEPPRGLWTSLLNFIWFLPYFIGLLVLGFIKGIIMFPAILLLMTVGISGIILGLWPIHCFYTYYCIFRTKQFGPSLKLVLFIFIPAILIAWPPVGIACGVLGGAAYGLLAPMFATFQAVEEGKSDKFYHCFIDGTWDAVKGSFNIIRDVRDVCYHSYLSIMYDLISHLGPQEGKYYEIRAILGDNLCAICWSCNFTLAISGCRGGIGLHGFEYLLGCLCSSDSVSGVLNVVWTLLHSGFTVYVEYSNDVLDMPEGSCFPRPQYRKNPPSQTTSNNSISGTNSFKRPLSRASSINSPMLDLKPIEIIDGWFEECQRYGEIMVSEGIITLQDLEYAKNNKDSDRVISIGLPAYCMCQFLLRSANANSTGLLLSDPSRLMNSMTSSPPESELRRAELDALARRLQGITKSRSRYPTCRRRYDSSLKKILEELGKNGDSRKSMSRSKRKLGKFVSMSFKSRTNNPSVDQEAQTTSERDIEIR